MEFEIDFRKFFYHFYVMLSSYLVWDMLGNILSYFPDFFAKGDFNRIDVFAVGSHTFRTPEYYSPLMFISINLIWLALFSVWWRRDIRDLKAYWYSQLDLAEGEVETTEITMKISKPVSPNGAVEA